MNKKLFKKLVGPILTIGLLLTTISTASATTNSFNLNNQKHVYNYSIIRNISLNSNYRFSTFIRLFQSPQNQNTNTVENAPIQPIQNPSDTNKVSKQTNSLPPAQHPQSSPEVTPLVTQVPQNTSNARHALTPAEIEMVEYVNQERVNAGLQPLTVDIDLSYVARVKSKDMQDNNYFSHTSPTYGSPFEMMTNFGIKYRAAAENIAINSSVRGAHNAFMNSEGHRKNILNPRFTHIGIGIENRHYTQMFIQK